MTAPTRAPTVGRFAAGLVGLFVVTTLGWMALWGVATAMLYGRGPVVVSSGSMAPALDVGDLVVVEPFHDQRLHEGSVVVFDDEASGRSVIHRVVDVHDDGTFTTRGDANASADSAPLDRQRIEATGRFLLPRMGLPVVWAEQGRWQLVALAVAGLVLAVCLARFALLDAYDPWLAGVVRLDKPPAPWWSRAVAAGRRAHTGVADLGAPRFVARATRGRLAELGALTLAVVLAHATVTAYAAFADTTANTDNQFAAGSLSSPTGLAVTPGPCTGSDAIAFRSDASATSATGEQLTIPTPVGTQPGDVMVAALTWHTHDFSGTRIDPPAGWQLIRTDTEFTHVVQGLFWKVAAGSEPATHTFVNSTSDTTRELVGGIAAYRGVDPTSPIDAHGGSSTPSNVFTLTAPSVTSTVAGGRLVSVFGQHDPGPFAAPSGMTERFAETVGTGGRSVNSLLADEVLGAAGATGTRSATSAGNGSGVAQSIVLDPAGGVAAAALSWTPTVSGFADGYVLQRFIGAVLDDEWLITPETASSIVDFGGLVAGTTYTYRLSTTSGSWRSDPVSLTYTPAAC